MNNFSKKYLTEEKKRKYYSWIKIRSTSKVYYLNVISKEVYIFKKTNELIVDKIKNNTHSFQESNQNYDGYDTSVVILLRIQFVYV